MKKVIRIITMCCHCPNMESIKTNTPIYNPLYNDVQDFSYASRCSVTKSMIVDSYVIPSDCPLPDEFENT
jgi:hypothetical protein